MCLRLLGLLYSCVRFAQICSVHFDLLKCVQCTWEFALADVFDFAGCSKTDLMEYSLFCFD
jgi:hypothetical protein